LHPTGAHNVVFPPTQIVLHPVMQHVGPLFTETQMLHELLHPLLFETHTVYVPAQFTVIERVHAPVFHK